MARCGYGATNASNIIRGYGTENKVGFVNWTGDRRQGSRLCPDLVGEWATVWKPKPSHTDHQDDADIVKAGHVYQTFDPFDEKALQRFASETLTEDPLHPRENHATLLEPSSNDQVYEPLTNSLHMRIVQLSPGTFDEEIDCILHHCSVGFEYPVDPSEQVAGSAPLASRTRTFHAVSNTTGEAMWYTALSYVWGDPSFIMSIRCNSKPFRTTQNLYTALKYLRRTDAVVNLWIDQICINQNDLDEKTQQVILMSKIYQRAWSTIVWLGEEAENSTDAHNTIQAVNEALQYHTSEEAPTTEDFERLFLPPPGSQDWTDVGKLLGRPWFQRLWIVQEAVLSRRVGFLCGRRNITWEELSMFAICIVDNNLEGLLNLENTFEQEAHESGLTRFRMIDGMVHFHTSHPRQMSLLAALADGRGSRATDPRDKVYGIMGMSATLLHPDYTSPVTKVYTEAALTILIAAVSYGIRGLTTSNTHPDYSSPVPKEAALKIVDAAVSKGIIMGMTANPLHPDYTTKVYTEAELKIFDTALGTLIGLLCCVDHDGFQTQLPSWVPDWSVPRQTVSLGYGRSQGIHQAAKDSRISWDCQPNTLALNISGFCFDTISSISPMAGFVLTDLVVKESPTHCFIMECTRQVTECCQKQSSQSSLFEAFWQTLVAGKDHSNIQRAPSDYAAIFALLIDTATGQSPSFPDQPTFKRKLTLANLEVRRPGVLYRQMQIAFKTAVRGRRFGTTTKGCMGLYPRGTQIGDRVCIFSGGHVPFVLRQDGERDSYQLIGECYQHGIMDGQVLSTPGFAFHGIEVK
ncbi:MAG: hypothetical protein Q9207_006528 [Kuettlingeria erythrocarpa]